MIQYLLIQHGKTIKFNVSGFVQPAEVGYRFNLYRDNKMTETDEWVVIKVFNFEESLKIRGLKFLLGDKGFEEFVESIFTIEVLESAPA